MEFEGDGVQVRSADIETRFNSPALRSSVIFLTQKCAQKHGQWKTLTTLKTYMYARFQRSGTTESIKSSLTILTTNHIFNHVNDSKINYPQ